MLCISHPGTSGQGYMGEHLGRLLGQLGLGKLPVHAFVYLTSEANLFHDGQALVVD